MRGNEVPQAEGQPPSRRNRAPRPSRHGLAAIAVALVLLGGLVGCSPDQDSPSDSTPSPAVAQPSPSESRTTAPTPTPMELEPAPVGLKPLVLGHNRASADRINFILVPWGWDDPEEFRAVAGAFVNWSGHAQIWGTDGLPLADDKDPSTAVGADLGLFGYEPFRNHRDSFNVWIAEESPDRPDDWLEPTNGPQWAPDQVIVVLAVQGQDGWNSTSISGQDPAFTDRDNLMRGKARTFVNALVAVDPAFPAYTIRDLPHELGHAMFGFADEYVGRVGGYDGYVRNAFWPSCADTQERAEAWWSSNLGKYDDQLDYWAKETTAAGFGPTQDELAAMRAQNTTAYVAGGCFDVPGSIRSAEDTLMGFNFPAYGVTNRLWAQQVLDLWSGG